MGLSVLGVKLFALIHRWTGGLIGLLLGLLGLSGAILAHKDAWISAPGSGSGVTMTLKQQAALVEQVTSDAARLPGYVQFPTEEFGLARLAYPEDAGAYLTPSGEVVANWDSKWDRPELWLFDFHHHLFAGDPGEIVAGIAALIGIGFIVTGLILWLQTRRTFTFRLWPARMTRSAIIRQHRDLGVVIAPILFLTCLTGAMMTLRPVAGLVLMPFSSVSEMEAASKPPKVKGGALNPEFDWQAMLDTVKARYPDAHIRLIILPRKPGDLITIRAKQPAEWLPNGRTTFWFAPEDGRLIEARDALTLPEGLQVFNMAYPLHAGKVGGLAWRLVVTVTGLALMLLGFFAFWSFWFKGGRQNGG
jgi:uncharacterized iron-regulated membrane protein